MGTAPRILSQADLEIVHDAIASGDGLLYPAAHRTLVRFASFVPDRRHPLPDGILEAALDALAAHMDAQEWDQAPVDEDFVRARLETIVAADRT